MTVRLASGVVVSSLIRRAQAEGGSAAVLARGDAGAGGVLVLMAQRGENMAFLERGTGLDGRVEWRSESANALLSNDKVAEYIARRRARDGDLWVVELNVADAERFAAEMRAAG